MAVFFGWLVMLPINTVPSEIMENGLFENNGLKENKSRIIEVVNLGVSPV